MIHTLCPRCDRVREVEPVDESDEAFICQECGCVILVDSDDWNGEEPEPPDEDAEACPRCGGSGGGAESWRCPLCRGSGCAVTITRHPSDD